MGNDLAAQLQNALKRAQEKTGTKSPEGTALGILRDELAGLFAQQPSATSEVSKPAQPVGRRKSMPRVWMEQASLGEVFYDVPGRNAGSYWAMANENGCKLSTERCVMLVGAASDSPTTIIATKLTLVEKDGKKLPNPGATPKRDKSRSGGGVEAKSAGDTPRPPQR